MLIWYLNSEPSDVPYSPNPILGWDFFFAVSYSKLALVKNSECFKIIDDPCYITIPKTILDHETILHCINILFSSKTFHQN